MSANENCSLYDRRRQRLEEIEAKRRYNVWLNERRWLEAKILKRKAEDERVAALHFNYVCNQQLVGGGRWRCIRKLRELEIRTNATGLVLAEEKWMRVIDARLEAQGIFIGSNTKKYLVDPELGVIPQLPPEP